MPPSGSGAAALRDLYIAISTDDRKRCYDLYIDNRKSLFSAGVNMAGGLGQTLGLVTDELSSALIPADCPEEDGSILRAVKTTGNGNCLYNAVSLCLIGKSQSMYVFL